MYYPCILDFSNMSNKYSKTVVDKYSRVWTKNLVAFGKCITSRIGLPFIEKPLDSFNRMLKKTFIIGRYNYLASIEKSRKERGKLIAAEISKLWNKLNFPSISKKSVGRKIEKVIEKHDKYLKKPGKKEECSVFGDLFDITDIKGIWLNLEDKKFYNIQLLSSGEVGHSTNTYHYILQKSEFVMQKIQLLQAKQIIVQLAVQLHQKKVVEI